MAVYHINNGESPLSVSQYGTLGYNKVFELIRPCDIFISIKQKIVDEGNNTKEFRDEYYLNTTQFVDDPFDDNFNWDKDAIKLYRLTNNIPFVTYFVKVENNKCFFCTDVGGSYDMELYTNLYTVLPVRQLNNYGRAYRNISIDNSILPVIDNCITYNNKSNVIQYISNGNVVCKALTNRTFNKSNMENNVLVLNYNRYQAVKLSLFGYNGNNNYMDTNIYIYKEGGNYKCNYNFIGVDSMSDFIDIAYKETSTTLSIYLNKKDNNLIIKPIGDYWSYYSYADKIPDDAEFLSLKNKQAGSFNDKPEGASWGYAYFCYDRKTIEGDSDGIMIYYKGGNVWVDALGRVVE